MILRNFVCVAVARQMQEQQLKARQLVLQQQAASAVAAASKTQREVSCEGDSLWDCAEGLARLSTSRSFSHPFPCSCKHYAYNHQACCGLSVTSPALVQEWRIYLCPCIFPGTWSWWAFIMMLSGLCRGNQISIPSGPLVCVQPCGGIALLGRHATYLAPCCTACCICLNSC